MFKPLIFRGKIHCGPTFFFMFMVCVSFFMFLEPDHGITNPMGCDADSGKCGLRILSSQ